MWGKFYCTCLISANAIIPLKLGANLCLFLQGKHKAEKRRNEISGFLPLRMGVNSHPFSESGTVTDWAAV